MSSKFCSSCGKKERSDAVFCQGCGSKLYVEKADPQVESSIEPDSSRRLKYCRGCGNESRDDAVFCQTCGAKFFYVNVSPLPKSDSGQVKKPIASPPTSSSKTVESTYKTPFEEQTESGNKNESSAYSNQYEYTTHKNEQESQSTDYKGTENQQPPPNTLASDFSKLRAVGGSVVSTVAFLFIYVATGWVILYWAAIATLAFAVVRYLFHLIKFVMCYPEDLRELETQQGVAHGRSVMNRRKLLNSAGVIVLIVLVIVSIHAFDRVTSDYSPDVLKIKNSHLTQFDSRRTIGEVFDRYFDDPEWSSYKTGSTTYIEFSGYCYYYDSWVRARIVFELDGDYFFVDDIRLNGTSLGLFQKLFLDEVFG